MVKKKVNFKQLKQEKQQQIFNQNYYIQKKNIYITISFLLIFLNCI